MGLEQLENTVQVIKLLYYDNMIILTRSTIKGFGVQLLLANLCEYAIFQKYFMII